MPERKEITPIVERARRRLALVAARAALARSAVPLFFAAGTLAAFRPLIWPLRDATPLWAGGPRALGLLGIGLAVGSIGVLVIGRLRGPSRLEAARAIDGALGLREVVASGYAFEFDARRGSLVDLARKRAHEALQHFELYRALPLPRIAFGARRLAIGTAIALAALVMGSYDPRLAALLIAPPSPAERQAARDLESAARSAEAPDAPESEPARRKDSPHNERAHLEHLTEQARQAARSAERGDRKDALRALDELARAAQNGGRRADELDATLRALARALEPPTGRRPAAANETDGQSGGKPAAAEALRLLARELRSKNGAAADAEAEKRVLERLSRGADEARRSASSHDEARRAAEALSRAREALSRGDRERAAQQLEAAARETARLDELRQMASSEAQAISRLIEASAILEREVQAALLGKPGERSGDGDSDAIAPGKPGSGKEGQGAAEALALGLARRFEALRAMSGSTATGTEDSGEHVPDRGKARRTPIPIERGVHARSELRDEDRAATAIRGLGRASEPTHEYRQVFPSYAALAEEAVQDESVPAARRLAVRRYFEAIRPGGAAESVESSDQKRGIRP